MDAPDAIHRWLRIQREVTAFRSSDRADFQTYERLKAEFVRLFPSCSSERYESAMAQLAQMCGV